MPKKPAKDPLKSALKVKRGMNITQSKMAKNIKAPAKVNVNARISQRVNKIRKP